MDVCTCVSVADTWNQSHGCGPLKVDPSQGCLMQSPILHVQRFGAAPELPLEPEVLLTILSDSKPSCFVDGLDLREIAGKHPSR